MSRISLVFKAYTKAKSTARAVLFLPQNDRYRPTMTFLI